MRKADPWAIVCVYVFHTDFHHHVIYLLRSFLQFLLFPAKKLSLLGLFRILLLAFLSVFYFYLRRAFFEHVHPIGAAVA